MKSITACLILLISLSLCTCLPITAAPDGTTDLSSFMITLDPPLSMAGSGAAIASVGDSYPISEKQAKDNIRIFTGNLDIDPVLAGTGTMPVGSYYKFTMNNSYYFVNQNSGVVEFALMWDNMPDTGTVSLSRDQAYAKGTEFARTKYENFDTKKWKNIKEQQINLSLYRMNGTEYESFEVPTYLFALREEQDHVLTPNTMTVLVNAVDGKVLLYGGIDRLLLVDLKPTITMSKATEEAENHFSYQTTHSSAYLSVITRTMNCQSLAWVVTLRGTHNDYEHEESFVIDAVSGEYISNYGIWPDQYSYFIYM